MDWNQQPVLLDPCGYPWLRSYTLSLGWFHWPLECLLDKVRDPSKHEGSAHFGNLKSESLLFPRNSWLKPATQCRFPEDNLRNQVPAELAILPATEVSSGGCHWSFEKGNSPVNKWSRIGEIGSVHQGGVRQWESWGLKNLSTTCLGFPI
jgi:hypothetical protein